MNGEKVVLHCVRWCANFPLPHFLATWQESQVRQTRRFYVTPRTASRLPAPFRRVRPTDFFLVTHRLDCHAGAWCETVSCAAPSFKYSMTVPLVSVVVEPAIFISEGGLGHLRHYVYPLTVSGALRNLAGNGRKSKQQVGSDPPQFVGIGVPKRTIVPWTVSKKFDEIAALNDSLRARFPTQLSAFPKKRHVSQLFKFDSESEYLESIRAELQLYFDSVVAVPEVLDDPDVQEFLELNTARARAALATARMAPLVKAQLACLGGSQTFDPDEPSIQVRDGRVVSRRFGTLVERHADNPGILHMVSLFPTRFNRAHWARRKRGDKCDKGRRTDKGKSKRGKKPTRTHCFIASRELWERQKQKGQFSVRCCRFWRTQTAT